MDGNSVNDQTGHTDDRVETVAPGVPVSPAQGTVEPSSFQPTVVQPNAGSPASASTPAHEPTQSDSRPSQALTPAAMVVQTAAKAPEAQTPPAQAPVSVESPAQHEVFSSPSAPQSPGSPTLQAQVAQIHDSVPGDAMVAWTASEYANNHKGLGWYGLLLVGSIVLAAVTYLVTKSIMSTVVIGMLGVILGIFGANKPKVLPYSLSTRGLQVGEKMYPYTMFKSFSALDEKMFGTVSLNPLKRYSMPITVHFAHEDGDRIIDTLAQYLPYEEHKSDLVDSLSHRFRL